MKLKNKKTGEIVDATMSYREGTAPIVVSETTCDENGQSQGWPYRSLAELNEEWEDYKEPEGYWMITSLGEVICPYDAGLVPKDSKEIGNYFNDKESAYDALDKLKAFKRLKDKGFRFDGYNSCSVDYDIDEKYRRYISEDLDTLFGGEE